MFLRDASELVSKLLTNQNFNNGGMNLLNVLINWIACTINLLIVHVILLQILIFITSVSKIGRSISFFNIACKHNLNFHDYQKIKINFINATCALIKIKKKCEHFTTMKN